MVRTHVILDGLGDPAMGQALSRRWADAGFDNAVDVAGQSAWLSPREGGAADAMSEDDVDRAADIARAFGLELRDRAGEAFKVDNDLPAMHDRMVREYRGRLAQALMFGLPALALQYLSPALAGGTGDDAGSLRFPWVFQMLLVGWMCYVAAWPILWQGAVSLIHLRATGDLLTSFIIVASFVPSVVGVVSMLFTDTPWFGAPADHGGPAFHATMLVITIAVAQRWLMYRSINQLSGQAMRMPRSFGRLVFAWIVASIAIAVGGKVMAHMSAATAWRQGLMFAMLLPPLLPMGAINRWSPGWSAALPVVAFAVFVLIAPGNWGLSVEGVHVEVGAVFAVMMTGVFVMGWRRGVT